MVGSWTDIDKDGRRLEKVEKICMAVIMRGVSIDEKDTVKFTQEFSASDTLSYIDRLNKTSAQKLSILDKYAGVKKILEANKKTIEAGR